MNNFASRLPQVGKPTTFGELHNGDTFRPAAFRELRCRKLNCLEAQSVVIGTVTKRDASDPVILVEPATDFAA